MMTLATHCAGYGKKSKKTNPLKGLIQNWRINDIMPFYLLRRFMNWSLPSNIPTTGNLVTRSFGRSLFKILGWDVKGSLPNESKMIVAVAPHTSNWDFFVAISYVLGSGIKVNFMAKHTLFVFPIKNILTGLGGLAIDRRKAQGTVEQMCDKFSAKDKLVLAITPEGTRSYNDDWKTGFLHISQVANVPVVLATLDFDSKTLEFGPNMGVSQNIDKEVDEIRTLAKRAQGKRPYNAA